MHGLPYAVNRCAVFVIYVCVFECFENLCNSLSPTTPSSSIMLRYVRYRALLIYSSIAHKGKSSSSSSASHSPPNPPPSLSNRTQVSRTKRTAHKPPKGPPRTSENVYALDIKSSLQFKSLSPKTNQPHQFTSSTYTCDNPPP